MHLINQGGFKQTVKVLSCYPRLLEILLNIGNLFPVSSFRLFSS